MTRTPRFLLAGAMTCVAVTTVTLPALGQRTSPAASTSASSEVTIYRDKMGVPHVTADTPYALFYGGSYAIAQDRLAQAELDARRLLGRMAEIAGPGAVDSDKYARTYLPTDADMKAQYERLTPEYQVILKGMYDGWISRVRDVRADPSQLPYEFKEWGIQPSEWSLWDYLKIMGGVIKYYGTGGGGRELTNLEFYRGLEAKYGKFAAQKIFDDVVPLQDPDAVPIIPGDELRSRVFQPPALASMQASLPLSGLQPSAVGPEKRGASRVLLIGAKKSATGNPIILQATADGPDLVLSGAGFDAAGYVFTTMSPVVQGRTSNFAWSITTGEDDLTDIYAETLNPKNPRQYYYNGQWREMDVRRETIAVKGRKSVTFDIETTVHGPIVQRENKANVAYAVRNAMAGNEIAGIVGLIELNRAKTFLDYQNAAAKFLASSNVNYAGTDKRIAIIHAGLVPVRAGGIDPRLPTPGTGEYEWQGYRKTLPLVVDPAQGYLHAWNNKITADTIYGDTSRYGKTFRTWLGRSLAESKANITRGDVNEFHRLIGNSAGGEDLSVTNPKYFTVYLKRVVAGDPKLETAVAAMDAWNAEYEDKDGDGYYDSPGLAIYRAWIDAAQKEVIGAVIGDWWHKIDDGNYIKYRTDVLLRAIEGSDAGAPMKYDWFKGRNKTQLLRQTVADAIKQLEKQYGTADLQRWHQRVYYRYYDRSAEAKNPDKPARPSDEDGFGLSLAAPRLGLQPTFVPDNGSEEWNMLVEVKSGDPVLYDSTPTGGQNLFVDTDGRGNPNIADQIKLHREFAFKAVDLNLDRVKRDAVSILRLKVPARTTSQ